MKRRKNEMPVLWVFDKGARERNEELRFFAGLLFMFPLGLTAWLLIIAAYFYFWGS